jgi:hypothetical protein
MGRFSGGSPDRCHLIIELNHPIAEEAHMSQQANKFLVFAIVTAMTTTVIASSSAQNNGGAGDLPHSSANRGPYADMPNSPIFSAVNEKANAAMATEPTVLAAPAHADRIGSDVSGQMRTYGGPSGEMPNSLVPGSTVARAKAEAAMTIVPDAAPMPSPVRKSRP